MEKLIGKNQSYAREINFELVIDLLRKEPRSGTQLSEILKLSNATISSIVKDLLDIGMIVIDNSHSVKGYGRKQVFYTINEKYGLILVVNIANKKADISLTNVKEENLVSATMSVDSLNDDVVQKIILKSNELLFNCESKAPLRNIVISLTGLINEENTEKHFVQKAFENHFHDVPTFITNDGNLYAYGELTKGGFSQEKNGIFVLLDYGIGGSFIVDHKLFYGDHGFSGEMGCLPCESNGRFEYIEDCVSLRVLMHKAEEMLDVHDIDIEKLFDLYKNNKDVHKMVLESASILGKTLKSLINVLDISKVVINGRGTNFGEEYLETIRKETDGSFRKCSIEFSELKEKGLVVGGASIGVDYILRKALEK